MERGKILLLMVVTVGALLSGTAGLLCDGVDINPVSSICCNGLVYVRSGVRQACCGDVAYDSHHFMCCDNRTIVRRGGVLPRCCGTRGYDALRQVCVEGYLDRRTNLGSVCCQTEAGWNCCEKGESCCVGVHGSGASVEIPGFRPSCCDIQNTAARAGCCARTAESVNALPTCCKEDDVKPICCWKDDGQGMECCPVTIGYCCGRERPQLRAADGSLITQFTRPTPRTDGDRRPPYREVAGAVPGQPPRHGHSAEHSLRRTAPPTRVPRRRPRPRDRDYDRRRPEYDVAQGAGQGGRDARLPAYSHELDEGTRQAERNRRVDSSRRERVDSGLTRGGGDSNGRTDEGRKRGPGTEYESESRRQVDPSRTVENARRGTDPSRFETNQGRKQVERAEQGQTQETEHRGYETDPRRREKHQGVREVHGKRHGLGQGQSVTVDQGRQDTGGRKWPDDYQTEVDASRFYSRWKGSRWGDRGYQSDQQALHVSGHVFCGEELFDAEQHLCCAGRLRTKAGVIPQCCGSRAYDGYIFQCCRGFVRRSCASSSGRWRNLQ